VIELPGVGKMEEGFDGETAWEMSALQGPRIKEGEEKDASVRASKLTSLGSWRDDYTSARTLGVEDVDGKPAWKVELTPKDKEAKPEIYYFDQKTVLLVRVTQTLPTAMGDIPVEAGFSDYRLVDGIQTPFSMVQKAMGQSIDMHFDKVTYNAEIAADRLPCRPRLGRWWRNENRSSNHKPSSGIKHGHRNRLDFGGVSRPPLKPPSTEGQLQ